ncbi:BAR-domain-containing protein, partial [Paraphysoderma sedebokerense]
KGLKKAVARLPQQVLSKAGYAEETIDEEFASLEAQFTELELSTQKLHDDSKKYKEAVAAMLAHQHTFASTLLDLYSPIVGQSNVPDADQATYPRPTTPPESLKAVTDYLAGMDQAREVITQDLSTIERRVIAPAADFLTIFKNIKKAITKRNHKRVDYDRWRNDVRKLKEAQNKDAKDEKRLYQYQQSLDAATKEYEHFNNALKAELPVFLQLRVQFIDPCFASLYFLQLKFYTTMKNVLEIFQQSQVIRLHGDVVGDFDHRIQGMEAMIKDLSILNGTGISAVHQQSMPSNGNAQNPPPYTTLPKSTSQSVPNAGYQASMPVAGMVASTTAGNAVGAPVDNTAAIWASGAAPSSNGSIRYVIALYDFQAQADGDLSFSANDKIEVLEWSNSANDWWKGRCHGRVGHFPANYVRDA